MHQPTNQQNVGATRRPLLGVCEPAGRRIFILGTPGSKSQGPRSEDGYWKDPWDFRDQATFASFMGGLPGLQTLLRKVFFRCTGNVFFGLKGYMI